MPPKPKTDHTAMQELKHALRDNAPGRLYQIGRASCRERV